MEVCFSKIRAKSGAISKQMEMFPLPPSPLFLSCIVILFLMLSVHISLHARPFSPIPRTEKQPRQIVERDDFAREIDAAPTVCAIWTEEKKQRGIAIGDDAKK